MSQTCGQQRQQEGGLNISAGSIAEVEDTLCQTAKSHCAVRGWFELPKQSNCRFWHLATYTMTYQVGGIPRNDHSVMTVLVAVA